VSVTVPENSDQVQWPTPVNRPDLWRLTAFVLLGLLIAVVVVAVFL
jgi:hypothetical protein